MIYSGSIALPFFVCAGQVAAMTLAVARQDPMTPSFIQPSAPGASSTAFDWWPYDDFLDSLAPQPFLASTSSSQTPKTTALPSPLSPTPPSPSPPIVDITALPPSTTNAPHPRILTRENVKPFSLAPVFVIAGLILGAFVGLPSFNLYERWVAKRADIPLLPGPVYVPVDRVYERSNADRDEPVHGSPSKHTRHGTPYSSYSVGRGLLGRIPSSRLRPSPHLTTREKTTVVGSEKSFVWPSLPDSSRSTSSQQLSVTRSSTKSTRVASDTPDDPFIPTAIDTKSPTVVVASRTSTVSTFAHASRFGEMWSDEEQDETSVVISPVSPVLPVEEEGEVRTGLFKKTRSRPRSVKRKQREDKSTGDISELPLPVKASSPGRNFSSIPVSPPAKPDLYTTVPARTSSPRSRSLRTPESSPRKPRHVGSIENVRMVDTSVLPSSPPTLTSPRLESEFFFDVAAFGVSGSPSPKRLRSSRTPSRLGRGKSQNDSGTLDGASRLPPHPGESERSNDHSFITHDPRPGPSRALSTTSVSSISEFHGHPPPKRTAAERFYARRSALDKVEEIIQRSKSQTSVVTMSPRRLGLDTVEEGRDLGRVGREFESGGIEQRLFAP